MGHCSSLNTGAASRTSGGSTLGVDMADDANNRRAGGMRSPPRRAAGQEGARPLVSLLLRSGESRTGVCKPERGPTGERMTRKH
jgi:hypothetical protein